MRFSFILALVLTLSFASVQWYQSTQYICPVPIAYRLGVIDESFSITPEEAKQHIATAESVWEASGERELFVYDDEANFTINFVFDERQATADAQSVDRTRLDQIAEQNQTFRTQIAELQTVYETRQAAFQEKKTEYDTRLQSHNDRVRQANDRGGATPDVFASLETARVELASESDELRVEAEALNQMAGQLNTLSAEGNRLIETYNQEVKTYNRTYGEPHEFTQGDYQSGEINIYKFSNEFELISVLAHEFGHALGISHVEEVGSLMYYLLDDELDSVPTLSAADTSAFRAECTDQGVGARIRAFIRGTIL